MHNYYVYILTNQDNSVLYIGVTNNIIRRIQQHKSGYKPGFSQKYKVNRLVYVEHFTTIAAAIAYEKKLKGWNRGRKVRLISERNPLWEEIDVFA